MKTVSKFGGKFMSLRRIITVIVLAVTIASCDLIAPRSQIEVVDKADTTRNGVIHKSKNGLPDLTATGNFNNLDESFSIDKDATINVFAVGEGADYSTNTSLIKSYDNDCVEVYFDLLNNKYPTFDANGDDRQYRIVWKLLSVDGINNKNDGVIVKQRDPDSTHYIMYIAFPWKTLGFIEPTLKRELGLDVAIDDNDNETRKALYGWNSKSDIGWKNTSVYGTLILGNNNISNGNKAISINMPALTKETFFNDAVWQKTPQYNFKNIFNGYVLDSKDLSGYFQSAWNNDYLFVKVTVEDNVKRYAQTMFDYGSIETADSKPVWTMTMSQTKNAGGALKNRISDTSIFLKKGNYKLRYVTDESHGPGYWDDAPPKGNFYGIKLSPGDVRN
jgi:hypothetical protein